MKVEQGLYYTKSHEWIKELDDTTVRIGITDFAQSELGDIVFVNLTDVGTDISKGETLGDVESVKAVSDVYSPVSGTIEKVNEELFDSPELINSDPYGAWFVEVSKVEVKEELMSAEEYSEFLVSEGH